MKFRIIALIGILAIILSGCATPLRMASPSLLNLPGVKQHPHSSGLFIPQDVKDYVYIKTTSPVDKMTFPIGNQTYELFKKNLPLAFKNVVEVDSLSPGQDVDLIIKPSIVKFESRIPFPAYKPYTATIVYHIDVYNKKGEKIYGQTTAGEGQTSKGLLSGFFARSLCAEAAQLAMSDAVKQIVEGMSEAEELETL